MVGRWGDRDALPRRIRNCAVSPQRRLLDATAYWDGIPIVPSLGAGRCRTARSKRSVRNCAFLQHWHRPGDRIIYEAIAVAIEW